MKKIILEPIHEDPVTQGKGILKTKGRVLKRLIEDRNDEAKLRNDMCLTVLP